MKRLAEMNAVELIEYGDKLERQFHFFVLVSVPLLIVAALTVFMWSELNRTRPAGWSPLWGWLFSPVPILRVAAVLQIAGGVLGALAGYLILRRQWTKSG